MNNSFSKYFIFLLAFIEGTTVMSLELIGSKMLSSFYGSSLSMWSIVIGITLFSLACGYFAGGVISTKYYNKEVLFYLFIIVSVFVAAMPVVGEKIMIATMNSNIYFAALVSALTILLPTLMCLGAISPLLINIGTNTLDFSGKTAGYIYAASTCGGIISTFLTGFIFIPLTGIFTLIVIIAVVLGSISITYFVTQKKILLTFTILFYFILLFPYSKRNNSEIKTLKILHKSEGILGEIKVVDYPLIRNNKVYDRRMLLVNNIGQTIMNKVDGSSMWDYPHYLSTAVSNFVVGNDALVLGLGGGSVVNELRNLNLSVDVVELDPRMEFITNKFFYADLGIRLYHDDARHFLNVSSKKYDLIVFDVFIGENPPSHILTNEGFTLAKSRLINKGIIIINFNGYWDQEKGDANRAIVKTLVSTGFTAKAITTRGSPLTRNTLIFASLDNNFYQSQNLKQQNPCCILFDVPSPFNFIPDDTLNLNNVELLTDEKPYLEVLSQSAALEWRKASMDIYQSEFIKNKIQFFK